MSEPITNQETQVASAPLETLVLPDLAPKKLQLGGVNLFEPLDMGIWAAVFLFFAGSAILGGGQLELAILGAAGIIVVMFFVGLSVELIIESIKDVRGLGTIVGFITNGPEALCLIVGLVSGDILFAASTPLGSNYANPLLMLIAAGVTGKMLPTLTTRPLYTVLCIGLTITFAGGFFMLGSEHYLLWLLGTLAVTLVLFFTRPEEPAEEEEGEVAVSRVWFLPALGILLTAGYLLDPIVSFTALHSNAPKGLIGFCVLSALTSWPEFKSCLALFRRGRVQASILNITVSNITNIWLASVGILVYWLWM